MLTALLWGAVAAASLVIGGFLGLAREWPDKLVGAVLAFGAGALISAVSFDLFEEGLQLAGGVPVAIGLTLGALTYFTLDRVVEQRVPGAGAALALGALLDGIPEQAVLGIGLASGEGISISLLAAIFVSNLPEAIGASTDLRKAKRSKATILRMWGAVAVVCMLATTARVRHRRRHLRRLQGRDQRLCRRCPAGHARRLDDPRGPREGGPDRRSRHRPRLRGGRRPFLKSS